METEERLSLETLHPKPSALTLTLTLTLNPNPNQVGASLMPQCITGGGGFSGPANGMCTMDADGIEGKMLSSEVVNGAYAYDYTIEQKGQPKRHLRTLFAVQTEEGRGSLSGKSWLSLLSHRPAGSPEAPFSARSSLRLPRASASLGLSAG